VKTRTILKLLKIIKSQRNQYDYATGLCVIALYAYNHDIITDLEYVKIINVFYKNKPTDAVIGHYWFWSGKERTKFLNKLIKKYSK